MSISKFCKALVSVIVTFSVVACDEPGHLKGEYEASFRLQEGGRCEYARTMTVCDQGEGCYDAWGEGWAAFICVDDLTVCIDTYTSCTTVAKLPMECYMPTYDIVDCMGAMIADALCKTNPADCSSDEEEDQ